MVKTKLCPMIFNSPGTDEKTHYDCIHDNCAWWVGHKYGIGKCAILVIAENIEQEKK